MSLPRPPSDITPAKFFEDWLPAQLAAVGHKPSGTLVARVRLDGDGGGEWELAPGGAGVAIRRAAAGDADADVTLVQSVADWRAIIVGEPGAPALAPAGASPTDLLLVDAQAQTLLAQAKGTLGFKVTGFNGRDWQIVVKLGRGPMPAEPTSTITTDSETVAGMIARTIPPAQAFFSGKIQLGGDTALAMQLGMAMMSRQP